MTASGGPGLLQRLLKLQTMSVREVAHRVAYRATLAAERREWHDRRTAVSLDAQLRADLRGAGWDARLLDARRNASRFFAGAHARDRMKALFDSVYMSERDDMRTQAARARAHRFAFFGQEFMYGPDIDWMADPVTRRRWPDVFHADVPIHAGDVGFGDVKHVWELGRQQYMVDLAKSHHLDDNAESLAAMRHLVRSWIAGNPYGRGVNWACALEPAFRAWSWMWAYHLTAEALDDEFHLEWLQAFLEHGEFLSAHLEEYSSPYNHLIGEASALWALSLCFPEFEPALAWRERARKVLEERLAEQFYRDGGSVEQSTFYHHATLGFYLLAGLIGRLNGVELSPPVWQAVERALDFSMRLTQPDGTTPAIGGADDGKPLRMQHLPLWDFRFFLAAGAVVFDRADYKHVAGRFFEDALWLLGPAGLDRFAQMDSRPPDQPSAGLRHSGYAIARTNWSTAADYVCFDIGEQAAGIRTDSIPNAMHGHADCLSIVVWLGGRRVLVDSGLYAYNCGGAWESHFRQTAAHNTARIDRRDQARHLGKMSWSDGYRARILNWQLEGEDRWAIGSHDGFARGEDGLTHRRSIWLRPGSYLVVLDEFVGRGAHDLEVNYQFAPGVLEQAPDRVRFDRDVELAWLGEGAWTATVRQGLEPPDGGWIADSLGVRQAAPRLTLESAATPPRSVLLSIVAAGAAEGPRISIVNESPGQRLACVRGSTYTDFIAVDGIAGGAIVTDASIAICRLTDDGALTCSSAGGTHVRADRASLEHMARSLSVGVR